MKTYEVTIDFSSYMMYVRANSQKDAENKALEHFKGLSDADRNTEFFVSDFTEEVRGIDHDDTINPEEKNDE